MPVLPPLFMAVFLLAGCGGGDDSSEPVRPVLVARPTVASDSTSAFAGDVRAREESALSFRVGGKLVERTVDVGDRVRAGDVLARLDPGDLQAQTRAAQAQLAAAESELQRARADQARFTQLGEDRLVSRSTIDASNAAATAAQGQATAARASLDVARNQAGYTRLAAPADGVITARQAEAGQVVGAGQPVFSLAADGPREVLFAVPEGALAGVGVGDPVQVSLWAGDGRRLPGRIREIAPAADPASRTFAARATIDAPAGTVELGQSARVYLAGDGGARLSVPLSALLRGDGSPAVFVVKPADSTIELRPVRIGPYGADHVVVLDGLSPAEWVVTAGGHLLRDGQKVAPVDRDNRPVRP
ncbi:efflux RND transporter periplasmic adaptor subunit [Lysobacter sp. A3-1-A15]|uniref:efflux RND transporter periplasmic adaptor subunit n=1 Tax=Novilysobacter viscosus TaxID=3098602 RepID=UPI002ED9BB6A